MYNQMELRNKLIHFHQPEHIFSHAYNDRNYFTTIPQVYNIPVFISISLLNSVTIYQPGWANECEMNMTCTIMPAINFKTGITHTYLSVNGGIFLSKV